MKNFTANILIFLFLGFSYAWSNEKEITAIKIGSQPSINGRLEDDVWQNAAPVSDFIQKDPAEGANPTNKAEIYFLYDNDNLYVGARLYHNNPADILTTMTRRDNTSNSERIIISIDSYNDKRTAYTFGVTASGVRFEYYHATDNEFNRDYSYNPVWQAKAVIDSIGWTAEMKIPFSQLRFNENDIQEWGVNINWWVPHLREDNYWVMIPKTETGWSSRFGRLIGIKGIQPSKRLEILPYISGNYTRFPDESSDNPFYEQNKFSYNAGLDLKMGLGPNFTLDATFNPDFGQVEADPATVNLTAYETIYEEKRPFFTERREFLEGMGPSYFYSRRIGAPPHGSVNADYADVPDFTRILGAMKLTGRTQDGLTLGVLSSLTNKEYAETANLSEPGVAGSPVVEPLTTYNVARVQQEFGKEASTVGLMMTGVVRDLSEEYLKSRFNESAFTGGADWNIRFNNGEYQINGFFGMSHIAGDSSRMINIQRSSAHYFQRPDASHVSVDSSAKSLMGTTGRISAGKYGGNWRWSIEGAFESPGFELNDMGVLQSADDISFEGDLEYRETVPGQIFHEWHVEIGAETRYNFGAIHLRDDFYLSSNFTFHDRSGAYLTYWGFPEGLSDDLTRGGPLMKLPFSNGMHLGYHSDWTANNQWNVDLGFNSNTLGTWGWNAGIGLSFKMAGNLEFSISPSLSNYLEKRQYIKTEPNGRPETYNMRYIFSEVRSNTISARIRLNYAFFNDLTLEIYAEPFAAARVFSNYGELKAPQTNDLLFYGEKGTTITQDDDGNYTVTDGAASFRIYNPDLNYISYRSNVVLRWEWLPGSTLYFVWQQNRARYEGNDELINAGNFFDSFTQKGINSIALKVSYWFNVD